MLLLIRGREEEENEEEEEEKEEEDEEEEESFLLSRKLRRVSMSKSILRSEGFTVAVLAGRRSLSMKNLKTGCVSIPERVDDCVDAGSRTLHHRLGELLDQRVLLDVLLLQLLHLIIIIIIILKVSSQYLDFHLALHVLDDEGCRAIGCLNIIMIMVFMKIS